MEKNNTKKDYIYSTPLFFFLHSENEYAKCDLIDILNEILSEFDIYKIDTKHLNDLIKTIRQDIERISIKFNDKQYSITCYCNKEQENEYIEKFCDKIKNLTNRWFIDITNTNNEIINKLQNSNEFQKLNKELKTLQKDNLSVLYTSDETDNPSHINKHNKKDHTNSPLLSESDDINKEFIDLLKMFNFDLNTSKAIVYAANQAVNCGFKASKLCFDEENINRCKQNHKTIVYIVMLSLSAIILIATVGFSTLFSNIYKHISDDKDPKLPNTMYNSTIQNIGGNQLNHQI